MALLLPLGLLRLLAAVTVLLTLLAIIPVVMFGVPADEPPSPVRRKIVRALTSSAARALLVIAGYFWIPVTRAPPSAHQPTPAVVIGNHASYIEILYVMAHYDVTFVAKAEVRRQVAGFMEKRGDQLRLGMAPDGSSGVGVLHFLR
jgi:1-acyl-sn-glycerol-3-phosphate acyltransferase